MGKKDGYVNINLRKIKLPLRQRLKVLAAENGKTLDDYCAEVLSMEADKATSIRVGGEALGGGISILGEENAQTEHLSEGHTAGSAEGSEAAGVQSRGAGCGEDGARFMVVDERRPPSRTPNSGSDHSATQASAQAEGEVGDLNSGIPAEICGLEPTTWPTYGGIERSALPADINKMPPFDHEKNPYSDVTTGACSKCHKPPADHYKDKNGDLWCVGNVSEPYEPTPIYYPAECNLGEEEALKQFRNSVRGLASGPLFPKSDLIKELRKAAEDQAMAAQSLAMVGLEMKLPKRGISGPTNLPLGEVQSIPHEGIGKDGAIWKDGIPCKHPGCLSHITHPCEGCGRIGGRYPEKTQKARVIHSKEGTTIITEEVSREEVDRIADRVAEYMSKSHVLSSADPTPRVVNTSEEAISEALRMRKQTPANKPAPKEKRKCQFCGGKMERWSATTLRCTACARNEAL
jgi:hypothetical protein